MSIKLKFSLLVSTLNILIIFLISFFILKAERKLVIEDLQTKQIALLNGFIQVCKDAYVSKEELSIFNYTKVLKNTPEIEYLFYIDNGKIKVCDNPILIGNEITRKNYFNIRKKENVIFRSYLNNKKRIQELFSDIYVKDIKIGTAVIGFSDEVLKKLIAESFVKNKRIITLISVSGICLGILGAIFLSHKIISPIKILATSSKLIGQGKLDQKIEIKSRDEIGQLAANFNQMAQKLKELDQMKQDFVSSVTHDLKSPLNIIRSCTSYILKKKGEGNDKTELDFLISIQNNTERLSKYISTLLDVAKIEANKLDLFKEKFNVVMLLREMAEYFFPYANEKGIRINVKTPKEEISVNADINKIKQVMMNLLSNALKYTEKGEVSIEVVEEMQGLRISVRDTGSGIPANHLEKVFDKFYRVRSGDSAAKEGTGLGLSICKGIVEMHGGRIWAESMVNKGSTFSFFIPN